MSVKAEKKGVRFCLAVLAACTLCVGLWVALSTPQIALGTPPEGKGKDGGDSGVTPVCIVFEEGGGIQSDGEDYCNDKQSKIEAIMTQDGHVNLQLNTENRAFYVSVDLDGSGGNPPIAGARGWRFLVGGWNESFDMRAMEVGGRRTDVNLMINATVPDEAPADLQGEGWRLFFDPTGARWVSGEGSTYVTVERTGESTWDVYNTTVDQNGNTIDSIAVLVLQTSLGKNKSEFSHAGWVTVPPFTATVTLVP